MKKHQLLPILFLCLFAVACYFPLFMHLDHMSVRLWDEARRAVNAFEMAQNGNFLVTHYDGKPEMWGTKPPLLIWCQSTLMKVIGYNEVALRLPSALAALATVVMLILFCRKVLKRPLTGFLAGLILITTKGYVGAHVARSGDFDSLLTLWETAYMLSFFTFFTHTDLAKKKKWLFIAAGFIALAGLTKGIAGFLFLPGVALFALLTERKELIPLFKWKYFWLAALLAAGPVISFYLLREAFNPGYIKAVLGNEVGGRYLETQGGHLHNWYHYFEWLYKEQFQPWLFFIPLGLAAGFWEKGKMRQLTALLLISAITFLLIISFSKTRIMWYMAPVYPTLALIVGLGFEKLISGASHLLKPSHQSAVRSQQSAVRSPQSTVRSPQSPITNHLLLATFILGMFWQPYQFIIERVYFEQHPAWDWPELKYRDFMRRTKDVKSYTIVHKKYNSHVVFYKSVFNLKGYGIGHQELTDFDENKYEFGKGPLRFEPEDVLMVCEPEVFAALDTVYSYETFREWDGCKMLKIKAEK